MVPSEAGGGLPGQSEPAPRIAKKETVSVRRRVANRDRPYPYRVFKRFGRDAPAYFRGAAKQRPPLGLLGTEDIWIILAGVCRLLCKEVLCQMQCSVHNCF
jgi:hypothetical protein